MELNENRVVLLVVMNPQLGGQWFFCHIVRTQFRNLNPFFLSAGMYLYKVFSHSSFSGVVLTWWRSVQYIRGLFRRLRNPVWCWEIWREKRQQYGQTGTRMWTDRFQLWHPALILYIKDHKGIDPYWQISKYWQYLTIFDSIFYNCIWPQSFGVFR